MPVLFVQSTIKVGNCPQLDEVYANWEITATSSSAGGGWKVPLYAFGGNTHGIANAKKYLNCSAIVSTSNNANKNRIRCMYSLIDNEPANNISVFKDKPSNYDCSCNSTTGQYRYVVK